MALELQSEKIIYTLFWNRLNMDNTEIETIRVAAIQIPFLPAIVNPNLNTLSEPEGNINFWIVGKKKKETNSFKSILESANFYSKMMNEFQIEYIDWLSNTVNSILENLIEYDKPDIILFPEYSLPISPSIPTKELDSLREVICEYL